MKSQFTYCPLIWIFTYHYLNNALNNNHKRALRLIYNGHKKPFNSILSKKDSLKTMHLKTLNFSQRKSKNLKMVFYTKTKHLQSPTVSRILHLSSGTWTPMKPWNPKQLLFKNCSRRRLRKWSCEPCPLCKTYLQHIVFIN